MISPDDLKVKQWVVITRDYNDQLKEFNDRPFIVRSEDSLVDGTPLQILAINLPFLAVTDGIIRKSIDVRHVDLKKANRKYVDLMKRKRKKYQLDFSDAQNFCNNHIIDHVDEDEIKKEKKRKDDMRGKCPECGEKLVNKRTESGEWIMFCRECGFEGGRHRKRL